MRRLPATWLISLLIAVGSLTACDGDGASQAPATVPSGAPDPLAGATPSRSLALTMRDIAFSRERLEFSASEVVALALRNTGQLEHDFSVERLPADVSPPSARTAELDVHLRLRRGQEGELRLRVREPGEYEFFCAVPGHRQAGMEGLLVIR